MVPLLKGLLTNESMARGALLGLMAFAMTPPGVALLGGASPWVALAAAVLGGAITAGQPKGTPPA